MNRVNSAVRELRSSVTQMESLVASNPTDARWQKDLARTRIFLGEAPLEQGAAPEALQLADSSLRILETAGRPGKEDPSDRQLQSRAHFLASQSHRMTADIQAEESRLLQALRAIEPAEGNTSNHLLLDLKARILISLKRVEEAGSVLDQLRSLGYRRTDFWEFCRLHGFSRIDSNQESHHERQPAR